MVEKEDVFRIIRSICFAVVFGFIVMIIFAPLLPPDYEATSQILETEEGVGFFAAVLFFFVIVLVPLPKSKQNLFVVLRSIFITALASYLVFVGGRQVSGLSPENVLMIMIPLLLLGLILSSWKTSK